MLTVLKLFILMITLSFFDFFVLGIVFGVEVPEIKWKIHLCTWLSIFLLSDKLKQPIRKRLVYCLEKNPIQNSMKLTCGVYTVIIKLENRKICV